MQTKIASLVLLGSLLAATSAQARFQNFGDLLRTQPGRHQHEENDETLACTHENADALDLVPADGSPWQLAAAVTYEVRKQFVENIRRTALNVLVRAYENKDATKKAKESFYSPVWNKLRNVKVNFPEPGYDYKFCKEKNPFDGGGVGGYMTGGQIYLCGAQLSRFGNPKSMAGLMIHEAIHATGWLDECETTRIQISAMLDGGIAYDYSGYETTCKISTQFRIR